MNWLTRKQGMTLTENQTLDPLKRIQKKIKWLRQVDVNREVFGSEVHDYLLKKVMKPSAVAAFETEHRLQLPESYKAFLSHVGNGGLGPNLGLLSLENSYRAFQESGRWTVSIEGAGYVIVLGLDDSTTDGEKVIFNDTLWLDGRAAGDTVKPLMKKGTAKSFLAWYEEWLDHNMNYFIYRDVY